MERLAIIIRVLSCLLVMVLPVSALAEEGVEGSLKGRRVVVVPKGTVIDRDYFAAGEMVRISGTVNGDVYAAGGQVLIDGTVNGDLLILGGTVTVSGNVAQDARIVGGSVSISSTISKGATVTGGDITLTREASISESFTAAGGAINLAGPVGGDVRIMGGKLLVSNSVGRDLTAAAGSIVLAPGAVIKGDVTYRSNRTAYIDEHARIMGNVSRLPMERFIPTSREIISFLSGLFIFLKLVSYISTLLLGFILLYLFPGFTRNSVATLQKNPWAALGLGFALFVLNPVLILLLMVTVVGIPLAIILAVMYLTSMYLARIFVILWVGETILQKTAKVSRTFWSLTAGVLLYAVLTLVPVIGGVVALFTTLFGLGAVGMTIKSLYRREQQ